MEHPLLGTQLSLSLLVTEKLSPPQLPDVDGLQHVSCTIHSADIHSLISSNMSKDKCIPGSDITKSACNKMAC